MKHFIYGSGMHGCLYGFGPHLAETAKDAADSLAQLFDRDEAWAKRLAENLYVSLGSGEKFCKDGCTAHADDEMDRHHDGAQYAEIDECNCDNPHDHCDADCDLDPGIDPEHFGLEGGR